MKVNFNNMRKQATNEMNNLFKILDYELEFVNEESRRVVENAFNKCSYSIGIFNCLSDENEDNFDELDIEIKRFED